MSNPIKEALEAAIHTQEANNLNIHIALCTDPSQLTEDQKQAVLNQCIELNKQLTEAKIKTERIARQFLNITRPTNEEQL